MQNWRTYTVFISSTFADMQAERDYLNQILFPRINDSLRDISVSLRVVDLRWGIDTSIEEESAEHKVLRVCLDEIDRSRPLFIGLLGHKYGWIPDSQKDEGQTCLKGRQSITALEIEYGFLDRMERLGGYVFMERSSQSYTHIPEELLSIYDDRHTLLSQHEIEERVEMQHKLKSKIKRRLEQDGKSQYYMNYDVRWDEESLVDFEQFGEGLQNAIIEQVRALHRECLSEIPISDELNRQLEFLSFHTQRAYYREVFVTSLLDRLNCNGRALALSGKSGTGKSSIFSFVVNYFKANNSYVALFHTTTVGQQSREIRNLLRRWIEELENVLSVDHCEIEKVEECEHYFKRMLWQVLKQRRVILCIDAIDGFAPHLIAEYLTFYPRHSQNGLYLFVTGLPASCNKFCDFNGKVELVDMPLLNCVEAKGIVDYYCDYHRKELPATNIEHLLSAQGDGGRFNHESPMWLTLSLQILMTLDRNDFEMLYMDKSFDESLQRHINELIDELPTQEQDLFLYYIDRLDRYYNGMPTSILSLLSVSYSGLSELTLQRLLRKKWDSCAFANMIRYLKGYIVEIGNEKIWNITHDKIKLSLPLELHRELCGDIGRYYFDQIRDGKVVNDNITYYLYYGKCYSEAMIYTLSRDKAQVARVNEEICRLSNLVSVEELFDFVVNIFASNDRVRNKALLGWLFNIIKLNKIKNLITSVARRWLLEGEYDKVVSIVNQYQKYVDNTVAGKSIKCHVYILTDSLKLDALTSIGNKEELLNGYDDALSHLSVHGPISLVMSTICRKYYNWSISKITN